MAEGEKSPEQQELRVPDKLEEIEKRSRLMQAVDAVVLAGKRALLPFVVSGSLAAVAGLGMQKEYRETVGYNPATIEQIEKDILGAEAAKREGGIPKQFLEWLKRVERNKSEGRDALSDTKWVLMLRREIEKLKAVGDRGTLWGSAILTYLLIS